MKISKIIFLSVVLFAGLFFGLSEVQSAISTCIGEPISIKKEYLNCLKNTKIAKGIRVSFDKLRIKRSICKKCSESFPGEKSLSILYELRFIVLTLNKNPFGGYTAQIALKESEERIYEVWVYPIDKNDFQIRDFAPAIPSKKIKGFMKTLSETGYSVYSL